MKKILGLDLGVASIGWALIMESPKKREIIDLGSRIISLSTDEKKEFTEGLSISKNQKRTQKRTQRKGYHRYQLRRQNLKELLIEIGVSDMDILKNLSATQLYGLRAKAVEEKIEINELARILLHLNQKRGYKNSRNDDNIDKKDTKYVSDIKSRYQLIKDAKQTIGQYFYDQLQKNEHYKIRQQVFPREAYIEEFDEIIKRQKRYHSVLTDQLVNRLKNEIIFYQRPLKSQKGLVSICEFEGFHTRNREGKEIFVGPRVIPKSSPLFQICKIWESINSITLKSKLGTVYVIPLEKKKLIFEYLDNNEKLTQSELFKILELKKEDYYTNKQVSKGIQGNLTKTTLRKVSNEIDHLLRFNLKVNYSKIESFEFDKKTGEVNTASTKKVIDPLFEKEPLYNLWHTIYSINDIDSCSKSLQSNFGLTKNTADLLSVIDFTKSGFGNKSAKTIRKILPFLMEGYVYSDACSFAGYNHSMSLTKEENINRVLLDKLSVISKNSLRQPVAEKILNQLVNLVNSIIEKYGRPDKVMIELARELKQTKEERNDSSLIMSANEKINEKIKDRLQELGVRATRKNIEKYKFIFPIRTVFKQDGTFDNKKFENAVLKNECIYCGERFSLVEALNGDNFDVDHIIPVSLLFDDSQTNKVLVHRKCNADEKKNKTAFDFIRTKGEEELTRYLNRISDWFDQGILSYSKLERLKQSHEDYLDRKSKGKETEADKKLWENFISRQLRETQYISKKAKEVLEDVCHEVNCTSGSITDYLRKIWGWDKVLENLHLPNYSQAGLTQFKDISNHKSHHPLIETISSWSKRKDHRHHAIDALVVASTKQGFIQRINTLNASTTRGEMLSQVKQSVQTYDVKKNLLNNYFYSLKPFSTQQVENAISRILISYKPGKRVATTGKRKIKVNGHYQVVQDGVLIPRGALSEETIYGKIKTIEKSKPAKYLFENPHLIFKPYIRKLVEERLAQFNNDYKKAISSLKNDPIYLDEGKTVVLEHATCYKIEVVKKYPVESLKKQDIDSIVDSKVKFLIKERLSQFKDGNEKDAFKTPIWLNEQKQIPIKTVRCFTRLTAVEAIAKDINGREIGFVKPGNNHHIAIYTDANGKKQEHIVTFWHAVERKKNEIPVIIEEPSKIWPYLEDKIMNDNFLSKLPESTWQFNMSMQQNEMFVIGLTDEEWKEYLRLDDRATISKFLYRVQKLAKSDYYFRHHLDTEVEESEEAKKLKKFYRVKSINSLFALNPIKIRIDRIGNIII